MDIDNDNVQHQNDEQMEIKMEVKTEPGEIAVSELEAITFPIEINDIINERDQLLIISIRKDGTIDRLRSELKMLEAQLTSAVSVKSDALARLDSIEGKEISLEYKEKSMEREKDRLNSEIVYLKESCNRTMAELLAIRQESKTATIEMEAELKRKNDELRITNASICQLTEANQLLKIQNEEIVEKLNEQATKSVDLINTYQNQVAGQMQLVQLYKMNSDADKAHINELAAACKELKKMLKESVDECGAFETKLRGIEGKHQIELNAKTEVIEKLKRELQIANEVLQTKEGENTETDLQNLCPPNVADNRRLHSCLTLTEIYSRFYSVQEELDRKELQYNELKLDTEAIIAESQAKAPEFENLRVKYKQVVAVNEQLTQKIDNYIAENVLIQEKLQNTLSKFEYFVQENAKLKSGQNDLAKQVCNLLNQINASTPKFGTMSDQNQSILSNMTANEIISKTLVTFNNIEELQETNHKLLLLVRDLSTKSEEVENILKSIDLESYKAKLADKEQQIHKLQDLLKMRNMETMRFQRLYREIMNDFCNEISSTEHVERKKRVENTVQIASNSAKDNNFSDMEKTKELKDAMEEYIKYRKETSEESKKLNEQINDLRNEVQKLTETNLQMSSQASNRSEQIKTLQNNMAIYKRQIETLDERNQMHEKTIDKHVISSKYLGDEVLNTMNKLSVAENRNEHLKCECRRLMDISRSLEVEHRSQKSQTLSDSILQGNLEMIKDSLERFENEGRSRMEQRLDNISREASALRRRLQDEQNYFREEINSIKLQKENAEKKMSDEQSLVETLRTELIAAEEQIEAQKQQIIELASQIPQSLMPSLFDNAIDDANSKTNAFEQFRNKILETENLNKQISYQSLDTCRLEIKKVARLEPEQKLECLNQQDTALYDAQQNKVLPTNNDSNSDSETLTEIEVNETSSDKLLSIIKSLRNEKDISVANAEILKSENNRLLNEFEIQGKRLSELNLQLTEAKDPAHIATTAKYDDILHKIKTFNAVKACNIHLCEERDALFSKVKDLTDRITMLEDELFPIQEKNQELSVENEKQTHECVTLRINLEYWMKRASDLLVENNKTMEDFKRLQNEYEISGKILTTEKNIRQSDPNNLKQTNVQLTQEITDMKGTIKKDYDYAEMERAQSTKIDNLSSQVLLRQEEIDKLQKENETLNKKDETELLDEKKKSDLSTEESMGANCGSTIYKTRTYFTSNS